MPLRYLQILGPQVSSIACKSPSPTPRVKSISILKKKKNDLEKNYYFSST